MYARALFGALCLAAAPHAAAVSAAAEPNVIYEQLVGKGVDVAGTAIRLPQPTLADGLSAAKQQQALDGVMDANHPFADLARKSVVAPFQLKISDEAGPKGTAPRRVDLWFVAYGDLEKLTDETFLKRQVESEAKANSSSAEKGKVLTDADLTERQIEPDPKFRFAAAQFALFDRVQLSGVMRAELTRNDESLTLAAMPDGRFDKDAKFPNQWRPLARDDAGQLTAGAPQPYAAAGWYCKVTRLTEPAGALLVEYHLVFDEPHGWFNGANLLRSKLPIVVQDGVRTFRRKLSAK